MKQLLITIAIIMLSVILYEVHYLYSFVKWIEANYNIKLKINE